MTTSAIRQKLHHYIETAQHKKIKAIYAIVEDEIEETYDHWDDEDFADELKRRESSYLSSTAKAHPIERVINKAKQAVKRTKLR
jgi:3-phenylpropionate/cinnamic acid dioxygenase small subunit